MSGKAAFCSSVSGSLARSGRAFVPLAGIGDQGGDAMLEGGGAGRQEAAEAPAGQGDLRRVDLRPRQGVVDDRADDVLPVGADVDAVLDEVAPLPGTIEEQHVVAAADRRRRVGEVHLLDGGVVAVGVDDRRPRLAGVVDGDEIARQALPLEGDLDRLDRDIAQARRPSGRSPSPCRRRPPAADRSARRRGGSRRSGNSCRRGSRLLAR